jgi:hypothetical protein
MRPFGLLILLAACSSSSSRSTGSPDGGASDGSGASDGGSASDGGGALTCGTTIPSYCTANRCDPTIDLAKQDRMLCPASLTPCGDYDLIVQGSIDTTTSYYYFQGNLLAVDHTLLPGRASCVAGPSTFTPPSCTGTSQTLPACSSTP